MNFEKVDSTIIDAEVFRKEFEAATQEPIAEKVRRVTENVIALGPPRLPPCHDLTMVGDD